DTPGGRAPRHLRDVVGDIDADCDAGTDGSHRREYEVVAVSEQEAGTIVGQPFAAGAVEVEPPDREDEDQRRYRGDEQRSAVASSVKRELNRDRGRQDYFA